VGVVLLVSGHCSDAVLFKSCIAIQFQFCCRCSTHVSILVNVSVA